ncbi:uncharacterized protein HMPREF1541_00778 [Cyphellophora europaea CBS 101466]|uniref:Fe2OG dioxygenase domain-containing protein n=1 Tax=Cyphellophora europaea (strain CBS 101466) TaxID=1220924 RepID=W2SD08_CYPE1|nr:uncharacterized protein HMPREF1541_00778 [Cyphellophora europaea CBS 101466]ETN46592.1 hypothetical protein HMPREF1541_00778 [Cyphellophora europaea CBS 101466]
MAADIAVVSFERFLNGDDNDRKAVAQEIYDAFSSVGWVYVKDHGISQARVDEIFRLAKTFFDLPLEDKLKWKLTDASVNQGYTADGAEGNGGIDHKECYEHRRYRNDLCPAEDVLPGFRTTLDEFYAQCLTLGMNVLRCLAIAMKLGDGFFDRITLRTDPQMRLLHYPAIERKIIEQEGHARIFPHTDFGLCTLLFQDSIGGLEVDPFHTGDFKPATPRPGTVLINIADLLQRLTNDRCKSTRHRVVSPKTEGDMLPARFSIPFFIHPDPETMIDPVTLSADEVKHYEPVNAGEWRIAHTMKDYKLADAPKEAVASA